MLTHNRLHFLGRCLPLPPAEPHIHRGRMPANLVRRLAALNPHREPSEAFYIYRPSCFYRGTLPWYDGNQQSLLLEPVGEARTTFTRVVVFRVMFEVTFQRLRLLKCFCSLPHPRGTSTVEYEQQTSPLRGSRNCRGVLPLPSSLFPSGQKARPKVVRCHCCASGKEQCQQRGQRGSFFSFFFPSCYSQPIFLCCL